MCKIAYLVLYSIWSFHLATQVLFDLSASGLSSLITSGVDNLWVSYNRVSCAVCNYEQAES